MADTVNDAVVSGGGQPEDTMWGKYLVFMLDGQEFALPIESVGDIINIQPYTRMPNCPDYVRGITNLRGKVIPLIDVRMRFGKEPKPYTDRTCIIVIQQDYSVGLIIDSVREVIAMDENAVSPPPGFSASPESRFVCGIGQAENGVKLILDCQAVLGSDGINPAALDGEEE